MRLEPTIGTLLRQILQKINKKKQGGGSLGAGLQITPR